VRRAHQCTMAGMHPPLEVKKPIQGDVRGTPMCHASS